MSALIDPDDDPIERCSALCSEVSFLLKTDVFAVEPAALQDQCDQIKDSQFETTVVYEFSDFVACCCAIDRVCLYVRR
jgi:hypothetical protein